MNIIYVFKLNSNAYRIDNIRFNVKYLIKFKKLQVLF